MIKAKVSFFDTVPVGVIINRLSSDIGNLDKFVRHNVSQSIGGIINFIVTMVMICIFYPVILILFIPVSIILMIISL